MLAFHEKIFDGYVRGTQDVFTEDSYADLLGFTESVVFLVTFSGVTGTSPTLTCQIEQSSSGSRWLPEIAGVNQLNNVGIGNNVMWTFFTEQSGAPPAHSFRRVRIALGGTTPGANVTIHATGRDY